MCRLDWTTIDTALKITSRRLNDKNDEQIKLILSQNIAFIGAEIKLIISIYTPTCFSLYSVDCCCSRIMNLNLTSWIHLSDFIQYNTVFNTYFFSKSCYFVSRFYSNSQCVNRSRFNTSSTWLREKILRTVDKTSLRHHTLIL